MEKRGRVADVEALMREIERYLRLLDALRTTTRPPDGRSDERKTS